MSVINKRTRYAVRARKSQNSSVELNTLRIKIDAVNELVGINAIVSFKGTKTSITVILQLSIRSLVYTFSGAIEANLKDV